MPVPETPARQRSDDAGASGAVDAPLKIRPSGSVITSIAALVRTFCDTTA